MQYSNSLKSSIIGNADIPKSDTFPPSSSKSTCNNNPPKVNKKKVTKLGAGHDVNQTGFTPLEQARAWMATFVEHYNSGHKHSGIALFTPNQVHNGTWRATWQKRARVQHTYYMNHHERFTQPPTTPTPAGIVGINIPTDDTEKTAA